jgi:hypothetical protein
MTATGLDSTSPQLAALFRTATNEQRRRAATIACERAASTTGLADHEVVGALDVLRCNGSAPTSLRAQVQSLVDSLDEAYFRLCDEAEAEPIGATALSYFRRARAASAIAFALTEDASELHEALYEALASQDDSSELVASLEEALR